MFYILANINNQVATSEVLRLLECFWYYLSDLPFRIQNALQPLSRSS